MPPKQHQQPKDDNKFLGKEVRVELEDGRVFTGVLVCFQGNGDLILTSTTEFRIFTAENNHGVPETGMKQSTMVAIPFRYVKAMHQRKQGHVAVSEVIAQQVQDQIAHAAAVASAVPAS